MSPDISRCPNCFSAASAKSCQQCGWQYGQENAPPALALGRVLDDRYRIGRVLGHGGFGITYLAWDDNLQLRLAIKEYLPRDCVSRAPDGVSLAVYSGQAGEQFAYGLDRFLEEARTLAHFDQHPGIVTVKNFFRAHGTGYCVMDYVAGITLRQYLDQRPGGRISVADALKLLMPVMDALRAVHKEGLLHRDLAPDNIYLTQDGRIKLLDFGAARFAASEHSKSLSVILKPGYAPEEQYRAKGKQGPWTDVYGLAATFYRAITGQIPPDSLDRLDDDELVPPSRLGVVIQPNQETALLKALAVKAGERYQSLTELQQAWRTNAGLPLQPTVDQGGLVTAPVVVTQPATPVKKGHTLLILAIAGGLVILAAAGFGFWRIGTPPLPPVAGAPALTPVPATTPPQPTPATPISTAQAPTPPIPEKQAETAAKGEWAFNQGDYERARAILSPLAEAGDAKAQFYLGEMYANGRGVAKDETKAVGWYRKAAQQGDAQGQGRLSWMYKNGLGVARDEAESLHWFRKAAEQGDAKREAYLGWMYANGEGVSKDEAEAVRWFRKAAEKGDVRGQLHLGIMYQFGQGIAKDEAEAVRWFRKAAEQGLADGQAYLGWMYAEGRGVVKDVVEAVRWFRKAAEQGNARGQYDLGVAYANGQGVARDAAEAVRWYRKAAEQGHAGGQFNLGLAYANGQGVAMDKAEAVHWFRKSAEQGHADAQGALKELEDRMKLATPSNPMALATAKALEDQLACVNNPEPGKAIRAMLANGTFKLTEFKGDGIPVLAPTSEIRVYGKKVKFVSGWEMERDGVRDPFSRAPGTAPPHFIEVIFDAKPSEINYPARQIRGADGRLQYPYSTIDQTDEYYEKNGTTIICYGQYKERNSTEPATSTPIYFAAELAPTANIPPEAPLCYKFIVSSLEEQLRKIKTKYPALYDDKITTNDDGSKTLLAKRKDQTGKVISYFYSTSPKVCNEYQKNHLATGTPTKQTQPAANAPGPNSTSSQSGSTATDAKAAFDRRDYERAFALWRPLAQAGDAEAQNYFDYMYERGLGVAQDHGEAVRWYRKSAEQGLAEAQSNLGLSYVKGQGIAQNDVEGRHWFLKSAEQGFADAQYNLGRIYEKGVGVETDLAQARYWFRKAASQGQANARDALKEMGG